MIQSSSPLFHRRLKTGDFYSWLPLNSTSFLIENFLRYGKPNRLNNDEALFADLLSTKVKGVPGDLLIPTAARLPGMLCTKSLDFCHQTFMLLIVAKLYKPGVPNPREVVVEPTRDSRRSSLLSSVELDTPTENKVRNRVACVIHSVSKKLNWALMPCCALFITQSQPLSLYSSDLFKTLSPGYYCQTASAAPPRTDSPVPSDSGIYSPPTSILPFLEVTILIFSRKVPHA